MLSKRLGILAVLALSPALAQVPSAPNSPLPTPMIASSGPMQLQEVDTPNGPITVDRDSNWSGYKVTGSAFTSVLGSWVVPAYHCLKTPNTGSAVVVALDEVSTTSSTFEAVGTVSNCTGTEFQYYAYYELYPTVAGVIPHFPVKSGDLISAEVSYSGSEFTVAISDITQGTFFSKSAAVHGAKRSSAEWIVSRVTALPHLMDFGKVSSGFDYTSVTDTDWATDSSVSGPISDFKGKITELVMVNGTTTSATPTALTTDGSSFIVNWEHE